MQYEGMELRLQELELSSALTPTLMAPQTMDSSGRWTGDPFPSTVECVEEQHPPTTTPPSTTSPPSPPTSQAATSIPETPPPRSSILTRKIPSGRLYNSTGRLIAISFEESPPMRTTRAMEKRRAQIRALLHDTHSSKQDHDQDPHH